MSRDPYLSLTIGKVPVIVLKAMFEAVRQHARISVPALFLEVRNVLGRYAERATDTVLNQALSYLIEDGIAEVRSGTVYRRQDTPNPDGWTGGLEAIYQRSADIVVRRGGRGRKAGAGPRKSADPLRRLITIDLFDRVWRPDSAEPEQRRFRNRDDERFSVPIYYATDRERVAAPRYYSNSGEHADKLARGRAVVSFPPSHGRGKLEAAPRIIGTLFPNHYVKVDRVEPLSESRFHGRLRADLQRYEDALFVFVHGFCTAFDVALKRTAQIALDTGFNGAPIAFSWPSRAHPKCYLADRDRISMASSRLADFLCELRAEHPNTAIHLLAHSVGAEIAAQAMSKMAAGVQINEIVLHAPDIAKTDWNGLARDLSARGNRVSVYTSRRDKALKYSDNARFGSARVGRDVANAMHALVDAIDASNQRDGTFWCHGYGFNERLSSDVGEVLQAMPQTRRQLERRRAQGGTFYVFRR